jgi:mono/diheme cytochrome c family protein
MLWRLAALAVLGIALLAGCGGDGGEETTGRVGADQARGKELFTQGCAQCHVLSDAGAQGQVGPNLDAAFGFSREQGFEESTFYEVTLAQIDIPAEGGAMPADIYTGQDAVDVAAYVASVAGTTPAGGEQAVGGGATGRTETEPAATEAAETEAAETEAAETGAGEEGAAAEGEQVFATAGCGSCHTLAAAGSSGTIGPNLDESQPSVDLAVDRVTNGRGAMPSFRDTLSEAQIRAVAEYVSSVAGS